MRQPSTALYRIATLLTFCLSTTIIFLMGSTQIHSEGLGTPTPMAFAVSGRIVLSKTNLFSVNVDGTDLRPIAPNVPVYSFRLSPDGRKIAYISESSNDSHLPSLWLMDADGGHPWEFKNVRGISADLAWSTDGKKVAYLRSVLPCVIEMVDVNNRTQSRLVELDQRCGTSFDWSPDGRSMVVSLFNEANTKSVYGQQYQVCIVDLQTALCQPITEPNETGWVPRYSPDGTMIAYISGNQHSELVIFDIAQRTRRTLTSQLEKSPDDITWSPDGQFLAFALPKKEGELIAKIQIVRLSGEEATLNLNLFIDQDLYHAQIDWTKTALPTPQKIVLGKGDAALLFTAGKEQSADIFLMTADGSISQLTERDGFDGNAEWSPDGTKIIFVSDRDNRRPHIFLMNPDGSNVEQLTHGTRNWEYLASWLPDGKSIVYIRDDDELGTIKPLVQLDLVSRETRIIMPLPRVGIRSMHWSSDGRQLSVGELSFDFETGNKIESPKDGYMLNWSPDGKHVAYYQIIKDHRSEYVVQDLKTGKAQYVFSSSPRPQILPKVVDSTWSSDGRKLILAVSDTRPRYPHYGLYVWDIASKRIQLLYMSPNGGDLDSPRWRPSTPPSTTAAISQPTPSPRVGIIAFLSATKGLCLINPDGTNERCNNQPEELALGIYPHTRQIAWSPDGTELLYSTTAFDPSGQNTDLVIVNADGTTRKLLDVPFEGSAAIAWSPDSTQIAFLATTQDQVELFLIHRDGSGQRLLAPLTNIFPTQQLNLSWSPDGTTILVSGGRNLRHEMNPLDDLIAVNVNQGVVYKIRDIGFNIGRALWSPKGDKIAVEKSTLTFMGMSFQSDLDIVLLDAAGNYLATGVSSPTDEELLSWSPTGEHLLFLDVEKLRIADFDGRNPSELPIQVQGPILAAAWSPTTAPTDFIVTPLDTTSFPFPQAEGVIAYQDDDTDSLAIIDLDNDKRCETDKHVIIKDIAIAPNRSLIATRYSSEAQLFDLQCKLRLSVPSYPDYGDIVGFSWSPDSQSIILATIDRKRLYLRRIWLQNNQSSDVYQLESVDVDFVNMFWKPDGTHLAVAIFDRILIFDLENALPSLVTDFKVQGYLVGWDTYSPALLVTTEEELLSLKLPELVPSVILKNPRLLGTRGALSSDGKSFISGGRGVKRVSIWDISTSNPVFEFKAEQPLGSIRLSPNGDHLLYHVSRFLVVMDVKAQIKRTLGRSQIFDWR